jgi:hypothetical protein
MRGDIAYRVYGVHSGRSQDSYFGTFRTRREAETKIAELASREMHGCNWAAQYHDGGFVIREARVDTDFEIPSLPKPRDRYVVKVVETSPPESWVTVSVEVTRRDGGEALCRYDRRHAMFRTFEPFRRGDRELALVSRDYTTTDVLDLVTGEVIAQEPRSSRGFCPAGFYVPDWWDVHDGRVMPGCENWCPDLEWPTGDFGFVWGCESGDDSSWKVPYLDLRRVEEGVVTRDDRFGYVEIATRGYDPPWLDTEGRVPSSPPPFIRIRRRAGVVSVGFDVAMDFDLSSGTPSEWQRLRILDFE